MNVWEQFKKEGAVEARTEGALARRCIKMIFQHFGIKAKCPPTESFGWFHGQYPDFPIQLEAHKFKSDLKGMYKNIHKTSAAQAYEEAAPSYEGNVGIVFNALFGLSILHDLWHSEPAPGFGRLVWPHDASRGFVLEPFKALLASLSLNGFSLE